MTRSALALAAVVSCAVPAFSQTELVAAVGGTNIVPRPQIEEGRDGQVVLAEVGKTVTLLRSGVSDQSVSVQKGLDLLAMRLRLLCAAGIEEDGRSAAVTVTQVSAEELVEQLAKRTVRDSDEKESCSPSCISAPSAAGAMRLHGRRSDQLDEEFAARSLAYLATAADYVWNPHD